MSFQVGVADPCPYPVTQSCSTVTADPLHYYTVISTADPSVLVPVLLHNHIVTSDSPLHVLSIKSS
jgi:hypothetical protein